MRNIFIVTYYTFLEGVRARFFVGTVLVGIGLVVLGTVMSAVPYGRPDHLVGTIGWGVVFLSGCAIGTFFVVTTMVQERESRILNMILAKPVSRTQYSIGKLFGFMSMVCTMIFIEGLFVYGAVVLATEHQIPGISYWFIPSAYLSLKCCSLLAFAAFFATVFRSQMIAILASVTMFFAGIGSADILSWAEFSNSDSYHIIGSILQWIAPQFSTYNIEGWTVYGVHADLPSYYSVAAYFLGYIAIAAVFQALAAEMQELK